MFARMKGTVAKYEVEQKSVRQKAANQQRAKNGKPWVQRSFGYDGNAIVPDEAAAIRKACHALLNGATLWSIAKEWNAKGLKTSKGYQWEGSKVRQVLLRPAIAGLAVHDGEILDGVTPAWKPIIDRDTWEVGAQIPVRPQAVHRPLDGPQTSAVAASPTAANAAGAWALWPSRPRAARNALPTSARTWAA